MMKNKVVKKLKRYYYHWLKLKNKIFQGPPVLVLMYHRVSDVVDPKMDQLTVSICNFEEQMRWLNEKHLVVRLTDSWKNFSKPSVVITFDDGYADNYINVLPILEKYKIPATFFVCTLNIDRPDEFWWDQLAVLYSELSNSYFFESTTNLVNKASHSLAFLSSYFSKFHPDQIRLKMNEFAKWNNLVIENRADFRSMSLKELQEIQNNKLIDIGIHTHHHIPLSNLSDMEQLDELEYSKKVMESMKIKYIPFLALPSGAYNLNTQNIVEQAGFEGMLLANNYYSNKRNKSLKKINRILVPNLNKEQLEKYLDFYL